MLLYFSASFFYRNLCTDNMNLKFWNQDCAISSETKTLGGKLFCFVTPCSYIFIVSTLKPELCVCGKFIVAENNLRAITSPRGLLPDTPDSGYAHMEKHLRPVLVFN